MRFLPNFNNKVEEKIVNNTPTYTSVSDLETQKIIEIGSYGKELVAGAERTIKRKGNSTEISYIKNSLPISSAKIQGRNKWGVTLRSDYDFAYMERFYEKEGIIRKYVTTATAKTMRGEFNIIENHLYPKKTRNTDFLKLHLELRKILKATGITWYELIQTIAKETYQYGNSIFRKVRDGQNIGKLILDDLLYYDINIEAEDFIVKSYRRSPFLRSRPHSVDSFNSGVSIQGGLLPYVTKSDYIMRQTLSYLGLSKPGIQTGKTVDVKPEDIVHFKYMIEKNAAFALPPAMASAIDVEDLRTLEENLVLLGWQYGHPILHITVDTTGLNDIQADIEINRTVAEVEAMDATGFLVSSHRTKLNLHYPNGSLIPIDKFVDYLHSRAKSNLDTAALLLGDGGNAGRQAGEAIEASSGDIIQMAANVIAGKLQDMLIEEIWYTNLGGKIELPCPGVIKVSEIDRMRRAARTNQLINLFNTAGISANVIRNDLSLPPLTDEEFADIAKQQALKSNKSLSTVNPINQYGETTPGTTKT